MWRNIGNVSNKLLSKTSDRYARKQSEKAINFNEPYQYDALRTATSIRLLHLHYAEANDLISADLIEVDLNDAPVFEALSYTWTSASELKKLPKDIEERPILINGKMLRIRMNLYHALLQFRQQDEPIPLWADQICMNQQDNVEKAAQLAIMENIYSSASRVRIWLGRKTSEAEHGIEAIDEIMASPHVPDPRTASSTTLDPAEKSKSSLAARIRKGANFVSTSGKLIMETVRYEAAAAFFSNPWFTRAWTLQEFLLAKEVVFNAGDIEIAHEKFAVVAPLVLEYIEKDVWSIWFYEESEKERYNSESIEVVRTIFQERELFRTGKRFSASEYLTAIRRRKASVLKDKFFAGKALRQDHTSIDITYGMMTRDIFVGFAKQCLWPDIGNLALAHVGGMSSGIEGLPSWVPDLSNPLYPEPLRTCGGPTFAVPIAVEGDSFVIKDDQLIVKATHWSTVKATGESCWPWRRYVFEDYDTGIQGHTGRGGPKANERFGLMFALLNEVGPRYNQTNERTLDVLWKILIGGLADKEDEAAWRQRFYLWFAHNLTFMRELMRLEMDTNTTWKMMGYGKRKWMVPLIAERGAMEQRVAQFLEVHDHVPDHPSGQPLRDAIAEIQRRRWDGKELEDWVNSNWQHGSLTMLMDISLETISEFVHRFERGYEGRRVLVTENGFLGSSVEDVKAGDVVCLVGGADTPMILRPVMGRTETYTLVGEAYIHGIAESIEKSGNAGIFGTVSIV